MDGGEDQERVDVSDPMYMESAEGGGQVNTIQLEDNSAYQANIQVRENEAYIAFTTEKSNLPT